MRSIFTGREGTKNNTAHGEPCRLDDEEAAEADKAPKRPQKLRQLNDLFARPADLRGAFTQHSTTRAGCASPALARCRLCEVRSLALRPRLSSVPPTGDPRAGSRRPGGRCAFIGFQLKSLPYFSATHQGLLNPTRARSRAIRSTRCSRSRVDSRPSW